MSERVGLLVVHGIGEQRRFETSRQIVQSIIAGLQVRDKDSQFTLTDRTGNPEQISIGCPSLDHSSAPFSIAWQCAGTGENIFLDVHEVWWADLGAPSTLSEQIRFWLWGLGQWNAAVRWTSHMNGKKSNTDLLMDPPTKFSDVRNPSGSTRPRPIARAALFITGFYAFLTLFSWEALKRAVTWLSASVGSPSILTSYIGDVRIYTQAPGKGGGNLTDIGQPWRATIRRRMVSQLVAMAERKYDRWYLLGHSLGSVVAFNGVQEPEWSLPNYLDQQQVDRLRMSDTLMLDKDPGGTKPDFSNMMPRRPVWLGPFDRISRQALFAKFGGLITYGSPLDKFAALWPRIAPINKDRTAFPQNADWINLSDATDPVGAQIGAYTNGWNEGTTITNSPFNIRVKASPVFLKSHIQYFGTPSAKGKDRPETRALVNVIFPANGIAPRLNSAFADVGENYGRAYLRVILAGLWVAVLGIALIAATSALGLMLKALGDKAVTQVTKGMAANWPNWPWLVDVGLTPNFLQTAWACFLKVFQWIPIQGFCGTMATTTITAILVVGLAGMWRRLQGE